MQSTAITVNDYIASLPEDRQIPIKKLLKILKDNLPKGFEECMSYGMIGYVVPHSIYASGYHCNPKLPLPFINIGSQKNFISMHHMGLYGDINLLDWFVKEYEKKVPTKLDMGKGCVRFKKVENIPFELIGELAKKVTVEKHINNMEKIISKK
jgi:uncharacterized protein YdhG (YjbR/CyaY superfamily)